MKLNESPSVIKIKDDDKNVDFKENTVNLSFNFGQIYPAGSNLREKYDSGSNVGLNCYLPKKLTLFNQEFSTSVSLNFSDLEGSDLNAKDYEYNTISFHMSTNFFENIPLGFNFGFGYTDLNYGSKNDSHFTGTLDLSYKLPFENMDLSLNLHLQETLNDFDTTQELWGLSFLYGQSIKWKTKTNN